MMLLLTLYHIYGNKKWWKNNFTKILGFFAHIFYFFCQLLKDVFFPLSRYKGWYAGYELGYNTGNSQFTANNAAVGYTGKDFTCHSSLLVNLTTIDMTIE